MGVTKNDLQAYIQTLTCSVLFDTGKFFLFYFVVPMLGVIAARVATAIWENRLSQYFQKAK